ncbi:RNA polymerase-binding protein DksA [Pseudofulvimonas gallinarii]|jgi:DnaK suppressor protein|uniref:RNA polymerase-binding transcription factor DksA n=2 Tax=Pseudofulvimonas gallinarii TaxID=634155 RepID=A0A4S3L2S5_9GAMM|nr:TraR/DksA family transcriptional regulator [Pseudofulvimonas gallinarii]THD15124.1 RNA polymerase-binding protein DksA [Pseudofulvimonas gallinarii]
MAKTPAKAKNTPATRAKAAAKTAARKPAAKSAPAKTKVVAKKAAAKPAAKKPVVAKKAAAPAKKPAAKPAAPVKKAAAARKPAPAAKPAAAKKAAPAKKATVAKATVATRAPAAAAKPATTPKSMPAKVSAPKTAVAVAKAGTLVARAQPVRNGQDEPATPRRREPATADVKLPAGYKPTANEEYMSPRQLEYFRLKLLTWRDDLIEESKQTMENLRDEVRDVGDEAERAARETENSLELRTRDRYRKLLAQIDKALKRIEEGEYGFCEETGEPIGLERLEVRPIARFSIDAQERWELRQKHMGE